MVSGGDALKRAPTREEGSRRRSDGMREFVKAAGAVAGTTKKNEKVRIIAGLLRALTLREAELAAQFLTGRAFAQWDERVAGVGGSMLVKAIAEAAGRAGNDRAADDLGKIYRKHGDLGDMAEEMVREARGEKSGEWRVTSG